MTAAGLGNLRSAAAGLRLSTYGDFDNLSSRRLHRIPGHRHHYAILHHRRFGHPVPHHRRIYHQNHVRPIQNNENEANDKDYEQNNQQADYDKVYEKNIQQLVRRSNCSCEG